MKILFICTGNTCRSPMAEVLFRDLVKKSGRTGLFCASAGLSAPDGAPASAHAVEGCEEIGLDLSRHRAHTLSCDEVDAADLCFVMTTSHGFVLRRAGVPEEKIRVANPEIPDPYGGDLEAYRRCRDALKTALEALLEELPHD